MSRFGAAVESQTAQLAGTPSGTTFNGYFAAIIPGASSDLRLRRILWHMRGPAGSITSDQHTLALYRQTVRAAGTGFSTITFQNLSHRSAASVSTGVDITTAAAAGTTGPTIGANPLTKIGGNTQVGQDVPWEFPDDGYSVDQGAANGLAVVNIGNAAPASTLFVLSPEIDE